jgi:hypothetical protein
MGHIRQVPKSGPRQIWLDFSLEQIGGPECFFVRRQNRMVLCPGHDRRVVLDPGITMMRFHLYIGFSAVMIT